MEKVIEIVTNEMGEKLYNTISTSIETHTKLLDETKRHIDLINKMKSMLSANVHAKHYDDYMTILEFNALLNIAILDLGVISRQLYFSKVKWEGLFYVKHAYSIIHATIERYGKQVPRIKQLIDEKASSLEADYRALGKSLSRFKKEYDYESHILPVRNGAAAHIESFLLYYDTLLSINPVEAFNEIIAFVNILVKFIDFSTSLLKAYKID